MRKPATVQQRTLGRTGIEVGEIGLGTEYLHGQSPETVAAVVREAVDAGVTYFDILWPYRDYLDNLGAALRGIRDRVTLAVHIGCAETDGQYRRSRDIAECSAVFDDMLSRLGADHADVVIVQWVDDADDYGSVTGPGGMLEVADRLRDAGRARFVGLSSHAVPTALEAVKSGRFDVLMFPINPAMDSLGGGLESVSLSQASAPRGEPAIAAERRHLHETCAVENIGLVAMKPFAGGRFFEEDAGPEAGLGPVQLLSYALSQPGVSVAVPGAKNPTEMRAVLDYLSATEESRDFSSALAGYTWIAEGTCVYCNHCLPCPSGIDIGRTLRLAASAERGISAELRAEYDALPARASDCIECGDCAERCPFGVDVVERIRHAARLFEGES
jgi:predicted aldo/keto reductase-like oxidoreductase